MLLRMLAQPPSSRPCPLSPIRHHRPYHSRHRQPRSLCYLVLAPANVRRSETHGAAEFSEMPLSVFRRHRPAEAPQNDADRPRLRVS